MTMLLVIITNLITLPVGIGIGLLLAPRIADAALEEGILHMKDTTMSETKKARRPILSDRFTEVIIAVLVIGFIATGWVSYSARDKSTTAENTAVRTAKCVYNYSNELSDALTPRNAANEVYQATDIKVNQALIAVLQPGNDKADVDALRKATAAKEKARQKLSDEREKNPYPEPPREVCKK